LKKLQEALKIAAKKEAALLAEINKVTEVLKSSAIKVTAKTGTTGKIFGSVTSLQIARAIRDQKGYEIDRKRISIVDEVKELGTYKASIDFGNNNVTEIDFEVIGE
jgi:large subunit ribosomal protein L9